MSKQIIPTAITVQEAMELSGSGSFEELQAAALEMYMHVLQMRSSGWSTIAQRDGLMNVGCLELGMDEPTN